MRIQSALVLSALPFLLSGCLTYFASPSSRFAGTDPPSWLEPAHDVSALAPLTDMYAAENGDTVVLGVHGIGVIHDGSFAMEFALELPGKNQEGLVNNRFVGLPVAKPPE